MLYHTHVRQGLPRRLTKVCGSNQAGPGGRLSTSMDGADLCDAARHLVASRYRTAVEWLEIDFHDRDQVPTRLIIINKSVL